jgi:peptidoglycan DL-endopeptidase LytE
MPPAHQGASIKRKLTMKAWMLGFPLVAGLPGVLPAQKSLNFTPPSIRVTIGPLSIRASVDAGRVAVRTADRASASAAGVLATGDEYVGTRYTYGGESPVAGFDCSGFVQYVYSRHGVELPRTSREQGSAGSRLPPGLGPLRPGDLMLFSSTGGRIDHVAIYAGDGRILHSSRSGGGVGYDDLDSARGRWFLDHHVSSRRVL